MVYLITYGGTITYDKSHQKIVESGTDEIKKILFGSDVYKIRQLLFCLDFYLDPYYKHKLPHEKEIYDLLQELVISSQEDGVIEDCLQLIGDYACIPLSIMEQHFDNIKDSMKPYARYVLDMP